MLHGPRSLDNAHFSEEYNCLLGRLAVSFRTSLCQAASCSSLLLPWGHCRQLRTAVRAGSVANTPRQHCQGCQCRLMGDWMSDLQLTASDNIG